MTPLLRLLLGLFLALAGLVGCQKDENPDQKARSQYESHLDQARFFQSQGQLKAGMTEARHAIALDPDRREAYLVVAQTLLLSGDADRAIKAYTELLTENPESASSTLLDEARLGLASAYLLKGQLEEAKVYLDEMLATSDSHRLAQYDLRIQIALVEGLLEEADRLLTEAEALTPDATPFPLRRSQLSFYRGDSQDAIAQARTIVENDPDNSDTWLWLAQLLTREGRLEEAETAYRRALEEIGQIDVMTLKKYQTIDQFAAVLRQRGKAAEADTYQEVLTNSGPGQLRSRYLEALALYRSSLYADASEKLGDILRQAPEHREAGVLAGLVAYKRHHWQRAEELLSRYLSPFDPPETRDTLSAVRQRIVQNKALRHLRKALEVPASPTTDLSQVPLFKRLSPCLRDALPAMEGGIDSTEADQLLAGCVAKGNANDAAVMAYLLGLGSANQTEVAIGHLRQAISLAPSFREAFHQILALEKASNRWDALITHCLEGLSQFPDDVFLLDALLLAAQESDDALRIMQSLDGVLQQHPQALPLQTLADFYLRTDDLNTAKAVLDRARSLPGVADADSFKSLDLRILSALAIRESEQASFEQAYQIAESAAHRYNNDIEALLLPVAIAFRNGQPAVAEQLSQVIKARFPASGRPEEVEGDYYLAQSDFKEAEKHFHKAWLVAPSFSLAMKRRNALRNIEQPIQALALLREWLTLNPNDVVAQKRLGLDYTEQTMDTEAEYWYRSALTKAPDDALILNNLAWIAFRKENPGEALELSRRAFQQEPDNVAYLDTYIWMLYQGGLVTEALAALQDGLRRHPTSQALRKRLKHIRQQPQPTP